MQSSKALLMHTFNPSPLETKAGELCESEAILVYIMSSRPARVT